MKKIFSVILALAIVVGVMPMTICAAAECTVTDNIIDITDKAVYEERGLGSAKVTNIQITEAEVISATEDNTTIDIVLSGNTAPDATVNIAFGTALDRNMNMIGHEATVTLSEGVASVDMTLKGRYLTIDRYSGTATYTLNFSLAEMPTTPPERLMESDRIATYSGVAVELSLKDYFKNAKAYYLIDGDEKTLIDGKTYAFRSFVGDIHTLMFSASNDNGECPDFVTVTIEVNEIKSGAWLGITTSNGSVNFVKFTDADGNDIEGLTAACEDKDIVISLPRSYEVNGEITATFDLTQNADGLPKLSTSNAFNRSNDTKIYTTGLSSGVGKSTMYLYNAHPKATSNNYTTYTISYAIENEIPTLAESQDEPLSAGIVAGESFSLDLAPVFSDADGDALAYSVKIDGEDAVSADADYSFTPELGGTYALEFFASDFMATSVDSYKVTLAGKNADVKKMNISRPGKTFSDIAGHKDQTAIEALASRGILSGKTENSFEPNSTMTRAEFATVIARGLGLPRKQYAIFKDVTANDWFYDYVGTAYAYGIIKGVSENEFHPNGTITREEAAVMVARAAKLCGMDTEMDTLAVRDVLAQFTDYVKASVWSQSALAFCYNEKILDDSVMDIKPFDAVTRAEIASMLYNMLLSANLL